MVTNLVVIIQSKLEKCTIRGELREAFSDTYAAPYARESYRGQNCLHEDLLLCLMRADML
jgi:hypothetical protein